MEYLCPSFCLLVRKKNLITNKKANMPFTASLSLICSPYPSSALNTDQQDVGSSSRTYLAHLVFFLLEGRVGKPMKNIANEISLKLRALRTVHVY